MSTKEKDENGKESNELHYDEDKDQLEENQEEETGEKATMNTPSEFINVLDINNLKTKRKSIIILAGTSFMI
jgi:hypothetical protein